MCLAACAPPPERKKIESVWPLPPEEPKIRFVDMFSGTINLGRQSGLLESIFGEDRIEVMKKPYGVAVGREGKVYIADIGRVWVMDMKKKDYDFIGDEPGTGRLHFPIGIAVADDGRVFVTDTIMDKVFVYLNGQFVTALGKAGEFIRASGVAVDEKRKLLYVVDAQKHHVNVYSLNDYSKLRTFGKRGSEPGDFNFPTNIAVDGEGKIYVADTGNFRIQVFDPEGKVLRTMGKPGDTPGSFARPRGIAVDSEGHIYVIDAAFQNFQIFDQEGNVLLFVGGGGTNPGQFLLPSGIAIDSEDRIYVINQVPPSLQIFQYLGEKWKKKQALEEGQKEKAKAPEGKTGEQKPKQ